MNKVERVIDEICTIGNLQPFKDLVASIVIEIHKNGCNLSCNYSSEISQIEWGNSGIPLIRISMIRRSQPIYIIWDILHEYGHFLSGQATNESKGIEREKLAWEIATKKVLESDILKGHINDFTSYRDTCLSSYLN